MARQEPRPPTGGFPGGGVVPMSEGPAHRGGGAVPGAAGGTPGPLPPAGGTPGIAAPGVGAPAPGTAAAAPGAPAGPIAPRIALVISDSSCCDFFREAASRSRSISSLDILTAGLFFSSSLILSK